MYILYWAKHMEPWRYCGKGILNQRVLKNTEIQTVHFWYASQIVSAPYLCLLATSAKMLAAHRTRFFTSKGIKTSRPFPPHYMPALCLCGKQDITYHITLFQEIYYINTFKFLCRIAYSKEETCNLKFDVLHP